MPEVVKIKIEQTEEMLFCRLRRKWIKENNT